MFEDVLKVINLIIGWNVNIFSCYKWGGLTGVINLIIGWNVNQAKKRNSLLKRSRY